MLENASSNIFWHQGSISRRHRETLNGHSGLTIWFTGFSASGKSTLAVALESLFRKGDFIEVYVNCPLSVCEQRDPKGIYRKARAGEIPSFTGISAPYETPLTPDIRIDTDQIPVDACARELFEFLEDQGYIPNCPTVPDIAISNS